MINQTTNSKFLGIFIDEHLTWSHHITASKIATHNYKRYKRNLTSVTFQNITWDLLHNGGTIPCIWQCSLGFSSSY